MLKNLCRCAGIAATVACSALISPRALAEAGPQQVEEAADNLMSLMDALTKMHPNNPGLANRAQKLKERMATLAPDEVQVVASELSEPIFTAAVDRLSVAATNLQTAATRGELDGAEYDSCGNVRSDTDSGRDLLIAANTVNLAAIIGDVACSSIVVIVGEGSNLPACIIAGALHEAVEAVRFESSLRAYCDDVINGNEIRGILKNTNLIDNDLLAHDTAIKLALAGHDADIKALLAKLQGSVDEANQRLKVSEALERQTIQLLLTPEGLRAVNPDVMTCTGDNCPKLIQCPGTECSFPIKR
jgi:hypothetical protein